MGAGLIKLRDRLLAIPNYMRGALRYSNEHIVLLAIPLIFAVSILALTTLPDAISDRMVLVDTNRRAELWQRRVENLFSDMIEGRDSQTDTKPAQDRLLDVALSSDIYRMKVFDRSGTIIWSTREGEVGQTTESKYFFEVVARGQPYSKLDNKNRDEIDNIGLYATVNSNVHTVAEIYRPFLKAGRFQGAIEFYSDVSDLHYMLAANIRALIAALSGIGLTLSVSGAFLMLRSNRSRMHEMKARMDHDSETLACQTRLSKEVRLLGELNEWLQSATSLSELFGMISRFMGHLLPNSEGAVYVYSNSRDVLDGWSSWNGGDLREHIRPDSCWGLRRGRTYAFTHNEIHFSCAHTDPKDIRPYYCFPILAHGETVGLMHIRSAKVAADKDFEETRRLAQMCAEQISMAIANVRMRDLLREQSIRDSLTGLFNRRYMTEMLGRLVGLSRGGGESVAVLSIDVDHFKRFNDNHGHDAGDIVLRSVAEVFSKSVSGNELACRPGGEEFAVILPGLDVEAAMTRAEAIRASIEALKVRYGDEDLPAITISIGVALSPIHAQTVEELLKTADDALYAAKDSGRNRVVKAGNCAQKKPVTNGPNMI